MILTPNELGGLQILVLLSSPSSHRRYCKYISLFVGGPQLPVKVSMSSHVPSSPADRLLDLLHYG